MGIWIAGIVIIIVGLFLVFQSSGTRVASGVVLIAAGVAAIVAVEIQVRRNR
jgi:hypothetical protein